MDTLEQEIIEKFHRLKPAAKRRVQAMIEQEVASEAAANNALIFDYAVWSRDVETLRQQIRADQGNVQAPLDVIGMLRDIRDGEDE